MILLEIGIREYTKVSKQNHMTFRMVRLSIPFSKAEKDSEKKKFCQQNVRFVNRSKNKVLNW